LKSDSGNLGVRSLSALCDELQAAARLSNEEGCAALVPRLAAEFEDVRPGLSDMLAS
jgi:HPt (histidine-containing phosphotransfer) domain-containing protein